MFLGHGKPFTQLFFACIISDKNSSVILILILLLVKCLFPFTSFKASFLSSDNGVP